MVNENGVGSRFAAKRLPTPFSIPLVYFTRSTGGRPSTSGITAAGAIFSTGGSDGVGKLDGAGGIVRAGTAGTPIGVGAGTAFGAGATANGLGAGIGFDTVTAGTGAFVCEAVLAGVEAVPTVGIFSGWGGVRVAAVPEDGIVTTCGATVIGDGFAWPARNAGGIAVVVAAVAVGTGTSFSAGGAITVAEAPA